MIINAFKEKKLNLLYFILIIIFSLLLSYFLIATIDFIYYSIFYYANYNYKLHPELFNNDPSFLKYFENNSLEIGWNKIVNTNYYNDEVKLIIDTSFNDIIKNLLILLALIFSSYITFIIISILSCIFSYALYMANQKKVTHLLFQYKKNEIDNISANILFNNINYDVQLLSTSVKKFISSFFLGVPLLILSIYKIYKASIISGNVVIIFSSIFIIFITFLFIKEIKRTKKIYSSNDEYSYLLFDKVKGYYENHLYDFDDVINDKIKIVNDKTYRNKNKNILTNNFYTSILSLFFYFEIIFIMYFQSKAEMNILNIFSSVLFSFLMMYSFTILGRGLSSFPRYLNSKKRFKNLFLNHKDNETSLPLTNRKTIGEIEFKNVSFRYPDRKRYLLNDVSFKINRGEKVAILSKTGTGKSTITKLLNREYDPTSGDIFIDRASIKDISSSRLHIILGILHENDIIFDDTIKYNITLGNSIYSKENLDYAYDVSNISDVTFRTNDIKYLSKGNKRQIQIARRFIKENEIVVLDSLYSNIDYKNAREINNKIFDRFKGHTTILLTNRVELLNQYDRIIYLVNGSIYFDGSYDEFISDVDEYRSILSLDSEVSYV